MNPAPSVAVSCLTNAGVLVCPWRTQTKPLILQSHPAAPPKNHRRKVANRRRNVGKVAEMVKNHQTDKEMI